jgi:MerR family transcriptional regulator, light-induced transcriptional regulator
VKTLAFVEIPYRVDTLKGVPTDLDNAGRVRIGELSRRVGVSSELLRAWERRYSLLSPTRTTGGFRLYDDEDERRVRRMLDHLRAGVSAAQAAGLIRLELGQVESDGGDDAVVFEPGGDQLRRPLDQFDDPGAHAALDRLLSIFSVEAVLRDEVLPYLHELGERWQRGEASIAQEHFASALLRGRLLGLARGWGSGRGPQALLACVPAEQHDLGLICFGLALRRQGWRIAFLGPDTPLATTAETARLLRPALVVVSATLSNQPVNAEGGLAEVAATGPLALAGSGLSASVAETVGARYLEVDPVTAAAEVAVR